MLNLRSCVVGVLAVLLVGTGCSSPSQTATSESAEIAATRVKANAGDADAQNNLALLYGSGHGVPQDDAQAVSWFRQAAEQGYANAQYNLGYAYASGQGVPQDDAQAVSWFRQAAEQGNANAQHNLGVLYQFGLGVPQDDVEAYKWRNLAASRASGEKQKEYAEGRDSVAKLMTPAQIADAQRLAREWQAAFEQRGGK